MTTSLVFPFFQKLRPVGRVGRVLLGAYLLACATLYLEQDKLILHPPAAPQGAYSESQPWVTFEPSGPPVATIVVFHGNAGGAKDRGYLARPLVALGYRVAVVEYPGFDGRVGAATVASVADQAPMDFELVQRAYPKEPLLVVGESFGAGIAAQVAGQHKASVCGVTLVTPWYSLADLAQESMPWFPVRHLLHRDLDSKEALLRYGGPVTVVGAALDAVIPVHHAQRLAQAVPGAQAVIILEVGHNNWWVRATKADWERWLPKCPAVPKSAEPPANTDQLGIKPQ